MPGRSTFSTTCDPSARTARWAWAIDAAASGFSSMDWKISSTRPGNSSSMRCRMSAKSTGAFALQLLEFGGDLVRDEGHDEVLRTWLSLMKVGPSSSSALRRRTSRGWLISSASDLPSWPSLLIDLVTTEERPVCLTNSANPWRTSTMRIWR